MHRADDIGGASIRAGEARAAMNHAPTAFLVDDDVSIREALAALISTEGWRAVAFSTATEFLAYQRAPTPACLILDVMLPDLCGLELQRLLSHERAELPVIFLSGYSDVQLTVEAMKAGAVDFLLKPFDDGQILEAVRSALEQSRSALNSASSMGLLHERYLLLSKRERQVMALVVLGRKNRQVGDELGINVITVKGHRGRAMKKMKARTLAELVRMAGKLGMPTGFAN